MHNKNEYFLIKLKKNSSIERSLLIFKHYCRFYHKDLDIFLL